MPRLTLAAAAAVALVALVALAGPVAAGAFEDGLERFRDAAAARGAGGEEAPSARALFRDAARTWETLADEGTADTRLYTNIGNARAFSGDLGEAVLAYRRALAVDPGNDRARESLESIRAGLGIEPRDEEAATGLVRALFFWHDALAFETRRILFGTLWIGGLVLGVFALRRRRLRIPAGLALVAAAALLVSLAVTDADDSGGAAAVLLVRTDGRTGDGAFYSASHTAPLPAGAEVTVLERRDGDGGWIHGRLRDGTTTWVPAAAVAFVVP